MKLSTFAKSYQGKFYGSDVEFTGISIDSRTEQKGKIFICLEGKKFDSHAFVKQAIENGAVACITSKHLDLPITQFVVQDTRKAYCRIASKLYNEPQNKLKMIAVTGTNGKTSTAYMLKKVFETAGKKSAYIGTLFVEYGDKREESSLTTPDPEKLFELLEKMVKDKIKFVFMEASAHAIYLKKLDCISFDVSVLTNVTRDHLDFFGEMDNYINAKKSLFSPERSKLGIINVDDKIGFEILKNSEIPTISYGLLNPADIFAVNVEYDDGMRFAVNMYDIVFEIKTKLCGMFNVLNILAVVATAGYFGIEPQKIRQAIGDLKIPGRFNVYENNGKKVIVDYAHTPDGLKKVLISALDLTNGKVITVFGCGGDRDKGKRSEMGLVASALSDYVIITNDNPRSERQEDIAEQIEAGILETDSEEIILDREQAIKRGIMLAGKGDVVVIAGKGQEEYIEINGEKIPFSDEKIVKKYL